jgi:glycosyltransferase involved in cell wall biosynthesis
MYSEAKRTNNTVSICMATFNGAKFIRKLLESVIIQLNEGDEIVISDDGSNDETLAIISSFMDTRIKVYRNDLKSGPVNNFENAIRKATGDIIFLCDQDDVWNSEKVQKHVLMHNDFDLVVSDAVVIDEDQQVLFPSFFIERGSGKGLFHNLRRNSYIGCCMSFKRKVAASSLPFPSDIHMHDWWIGLVAEVTGSVYFLNEPLMSYVRHSENTSGTLVKGLPFGTQLKNRAILLKNILKFWLFRNDRNK